MGELIQNYCKVYILNNKQLLFVLIKQTIYGQLESLCLVTAIMTEK